MYKHLIFIIITCLACSSAQAATCEEPLQPYSADYLGSYNGWKIKTTRTLEPLEGQENHWQLSMHAKHMFGSIREESRFLMTEENAISSQAYSYRKRTIGRKKEKTLQFDHEKNQALFTDDDGDQETATLDDFALDKLNFQLQLRCDLMAEKEELAYPVYARDEKEIMTFQVIGEETLETDVGKLKTVVVKKVRDNDKRHTTIWFAKNLDYVMVKLLQEKREDAQAYLLYITDFRDAKGSRHKQQKEQAEEEEDESVFPL